MLSSGIIFIFIIYMTSMLSYVIDTNLVIGRFFNLMQKAVQSFQNDPNQILQLVKKEGFSLEHDHGLYAQTSPSYHLDYRTKLVDFDVIATIEVHPELRLIRVIVDTKNKWEYYSILIEAHVAAKKVVELVMKASVIPLKGPTKQPSSFSDTIQVPVKIFPATFKHMMKMFKPRFKYQCNTKSSQIACVFYRDVLHVTPRVGQRNHIKKWTEPGFYRRIQDARRKGEEANDVQKRINRYIAQRFRDTTVRAPLVPREFEDTEYLYRSVHGPLKETLLRYNQLKDDGYIAFSRNLEISQRFGTAILRLHVRDVPRGTPWIWFDQNFSTRRRQNRLESDADEQEVLLPPGTIKIQRFVKTEYPPFAWQNVILFDHDDYDEEPEYKMYDVTYEPSWNAKSVSGHPVHRQHYRRK